MTTARDRPPEEAAEDTSFARGLRLLLVVADRGEVRADELGAALEMPVSTVYRYLRTLVDFGFVDRTGGTFRLGPKLLIGTGANVSSEQLIRHADPVLRRLVAFTGETAIVVRRIGLASVCMHAIETTSPLRATYQTGSMSPLHAGAPARVLLAFAPPEVLDEVLSTELERVTEDTLDADALRDSLGQIVLSGHAVSEGRAAAGHGRCRRAGLPRGRDRRRDRRGRSVLPLRRDLAGPGDPRRPRGGRHVERRPRGGPDAVTAGRISHHSADVCLMTWKSDA